MGGCFTFFPGTASVLHTNHGPTVLRTLEIQVITLIKDDRRQKKTN